MTKQEFYDKYYPEDRYEDGDIDIEQLYDAIGEAYDEGYKQAIKGLKNDKKL